MSSSSTFPSASVEKSWLQALHQILHEVQIKEVFKDCKEFVDMPMKKSPEEILKAWEELEKSSVTKSVLDAFVRINDQLYREHFEPAGTDVEQVTSFPDWHPSPRILEMIADPKFKAWANKLHELWPMFGRKTKKEVKEFPERYTILHQDFPYLVPGGRFREFYYWDTFWLILGLLLSEMYDTAMGIIHNMTRMVAQHGFVPNGSRTYYLNRSQPPLLSEMVVAYYKATNNRDFVMEVVPYLEKEFDYWMSKDKGHAVEVRDREGNVHIMNRYMTNVRGPRPESYREDLLAAKELQHLASHLLYRYFMQRWFAARVASDDNNDDDDNNNNKYHMKNIHIMDLIPVDLNGILYKYMLNLNYLFNEINQPQQAAHYKRLAEERKVAIEKILWNEQDSQWYDYDWVAQQTKKIVAASNFVPLWAGCTTANQSEMAVKAFETSGLLHVGGIAATTVRGTNQQWDFPNGWPPCQWFLVEGLRNSNTADGARLAREIAVNWLNSNIAGFENEKTLSKMLEKYDVTTWGEHGRGGEYTSQEGFGWTNGVALCFLEHYGKEVTYQKFGEKVSNIISTPVRAVPVV